MGWENSDFPWPMYTVAIYLQQLYSITSGFFPPFLPPLLFLSLKNKSKSLPLLITKIQRKGISLQLKSL